MIDEYTKRMIKHKQGFKILCDEYIIPDNKLSPKAIILKSILQKILEIKNTRNYAIWCKSNKSIPIISI